MTFPYEDSAKRGDPMPTELSWAEQGHYQAIASLTVRYINKGISAEQAIKEKREIDRCAVDAMWQEKLIKCSSNLWKDIEYAAIKVKNAGIEYDPPVRELLDIIYGFLRYTQEERKQHEKQLESMRKETA